MRKHPDVLAILFLGFVLLVGTGVRSVTQRITHSEQFRVHQLKVTEEVRRETREAVESARRELRENLSGAKREAHEGILEVKDALRESLRDEARRALRHARP